MMSFEDLLVFVDKPTLIREALELITDKWVDEDNASMQTLTDLRDACRELIRILDSIQANPGVTFEQFEEMCRSKYGPEGEYSFVETELGYSCRVRAGITALLTYDKATGNWSEQIRDSNIKGAILIKKD